MSRTEVMSRFWDRTAFLTGIGAQTVTVEQNAACERVIEFLDEAPPPLRSMPALADMLIAAYEAGKAAR